MERQLKPPTNAQEAIDAGYSKPILAEGDWYTLSLLVRPEQDLGQKFEAFDCEENKMLRINGWLFEILEPNEED